MSAVVISMAEFRARWYQNDIVVSIERMHTRSMSIDKLEALIWCLADARKMVPSIAERAERVAQRLERELRGRIIPFPRPKRRRAKKAAKG